MAKRSFRGRPKKSKGANPSGMMAQFQEMQQKMATQQEELAHETVSITAGGGAITVVITGHQRLQSIEIQPELIDKHRRISQGVPAQSRVEPVGELLGILVAP